MRWFWGTLLALVLTGLWFVVDRAPTTTGTRPDPLTGTDAPSASTAVGTPSATPNAEAPAEPPQPEIDLLGESGARVVPLEPTAFARPLIIPDLRNPTDVVRRLDDRTLELDGRFRVTGNGSPNDPYRISWELLTSSSSFIDPAQTATTPPPWVRLLDGTYIELSGYYSTALRVPIATNLLLTLNRWDGCCIGLPPTPFDAIDVTMRTPLPLEGAHLIRFGTFRGRLSVSVFEIGGFLLGLYRLEDTTFETK
jgi:hypothetical protein